MRTSFKKMTAGAAAALALVALPLHAEPILNGDFETGMTNWTAVDQVGSEGSFMLQSGTSSPVTGTTVAAPGGGNAAMTDAEGPGSHALYQDFMQATAVGSARLSFDLFIGNRAGAFSVPDPLSLDFATPALNQQARVDLLLGGSDPFSLAAEDLLLNLFATLPGDPLVSGYNHVEVDITALLNANLNRSLRLRFAEVDNVSLFQFGVDNVALAIGDTNEVPEPASMLLLLGGLAAAALSRRRSLRV
jgi:hypothetical protein